MSEPVLKSVSPATPALLLSPVKKVLLPKSAAITLSSRPTARCPQQSSRNIICINICAAMPEPVSTSVLWSAAVMLLKKVLCLPTVPPLRAVNWPWAATFWLRLCPGADTTLRTLSSSVNVSSKRMFTPVFTLMNLKSPAVIPNSVLKKSPVISRT